MTAFLDSYPKYYMHKKSTLNTLKRQIGGGGGGKEGVGFSEMFHKLGGGDVFVIINTGGVVSIT